MDWLWHPAVVHAATAVRVSRCEHGFRACSKILIRECGTEVPSPNFTRMRSHSPIVEIGKALRQTFWEVAREPMPERWVDLIARLDREEAQKAIPAAEEGSVAQKGKREGVRTKLS